MCSGPGRDFYVGRTMGFQYKGILDSMLYWDLNQGVDECLYRVIVLGASLEPDLHGDLDLDVDREEDLWGGFGSLELQDLLVGWSLS